MNPLVTKKKSGQIEELEEKPAPEMEFCPNATYTAEVSRLNSTDSNFPSMQTLTESLHDQEQLEGCAYSDGYRDVLESVQELGFSHRAQEEDFRLLNEDNRRLKEARTCKVCRVAEVNVVILPCGHLVSCTECTPTLQSCPACRQKIGGTVRTFLN